MKRILTGLCGLMVFAVCATVSQAAGFPDRPIKLIVPWAAGGDTDNIFRPFAQAYQKALGGTPVIIANIGGASGVVGEREAKGAPPDGYTLFAEHDFIHSTYYLGMSDILYTEFEPICLVSSTPSILTASPKSKWKTLKELVADAKARPEQITVGASLGSTSHFFPALLEKAANIKFKYVSYDGLAQRMNAILGSHIDLTDGNLTQKGKVDAGQLRFLAIGTEKRSPEIPNVPTFKELGFNVLYAVSRGVMAPKGTPDDVLVKLESACGQAAKDPAFAESMKLQGTDVRYLGRKPFASFLVENDKLNKDIAQAVGLLKR
jgi:tripartite-type tricarboxylate transporter receptor subunit TctC